MTTPGAGEPQAQKALTHRETMWIVAGVLLPVFMGSMDQTVVSSALPAAFLAAAAGAASIAGAAKPVSDGKSKSLPLAAAW